MDTNQTAGQTLTNAFKHLTPAYKHIVIGLGEVGWALYNIILAVGYDINKPNYKSTPLGQFDFMHICIPYGPNFITAVRNYQRQFEAKYVVIHSTVPIGTCDKYGWTHSPVRGKHPDLAKSLLTFKKYVGGVNAVAVAKELEKAGFNTQVVTKAANTEAGKLYDLFQYAASIMVEKHIFNMCEKLHLDFDRVYRNFNKTYNEGYHAMGMDEVIRPVLEHKPGPIGGHCVIPMLKLLDDNNAREIIKSNELL